MIYGYANHALAVWKELVQIWLRIGQVWKWVQRESCQVQRTLFKWPLFLPFMHLFCTKSKFKIVNAFHFGFPKCCFLCEEKLGSALMGNNNKTKQNKRGIKQRKEKLGSALKGNNKTKQNKRWIKHKQTTTTKSRK